MDEDKIKGLADLLLGAMSGGNTDALEELANGPWKPDSTPESMVEKLADALIDEREANPLFKVGDFITPKAESNMKGRGRPFIVEAVYDPPLWIGDAPSPAKPFSLLVAVLIKDKVLRYKAQHEDYEFFQYVK